MTPQPGGYTGRGSRVREARRADLHERSAREDILQRVLGCSDAAGAQDRHADAARAGVQRIVDFACRLEEAAAAPGAAASTRLPEIAARALADFEAALDDDLNTPKAFAALFDFIHQANAELDAAAAVTPAQDIAAAHDAIERMDLVFGLLPLARAHARVDPQFERWVEDMLASRAAARGRRDFAAADAARDQLAAAGVIVEDTPSGTRWKVGATSS